MGAHLRAPRAAVPGATAAWPGRRHSDSLGPMRAIQMTEFGGPEVLKLAELPTPEPGPEETLIRVTRAGLNFADTHTRTNSYVQQGHAPAGARRRGGGRARGHGRARGRARRQRRLRRVRDRARGSSCFPIPDGARRRHGAGDDHPGDDRVAPVPHRRRAWRRARAWSSTAPPAASARLAVQLGHPLGAGRVIATASSEREARAGARAGRRRGDRPGRRGADRAPDRGQRRAAGGRRLRDVRRRGVRRLLPGARAVRADRRLRDRHAASPTRCARARCCATRARWSASTCSTAWSGPACSPTRSRTCSRAPPRRAEGDRRAHLSARAGRPGADRPARAAHHRQAAARPVRLSSISIAMAKSFADLGLSESTLQALRDVGYESPSPIQEQAIPALLAGPRRDRPGADGHRQDGRVRAADHGVRRPVRAGRAGARADAHARAVHPGHAGAAHLRRAHAASTWWRCSAARRSAPSRRSCAPAGTWWWGRSGACST